MPKNSVGESVTVALFSGSEKVWIGGGGGVSKFSIKNLLLRVPKISVGKSLIVASFSGSEKVWIGGGWCIRIFRQKFYVSQCRKFL